MTQEEIETLAGHRNVPPWIVKLVGDAVATEREACAKLCDDVTWEGPFKSAAIAISNRIRARGQV